MLKRNGETTKNDFIKAELRISLNGDVTEIFDNNECQHYRHRARC